MLSIGEKPDVVNRPGLTFSLVGSCYPAEFLAIRVRDCCDHATHPGQEMQKSATTGLTLWLLILQESISLPLLAYSTGQPQFISEISVSTRAGLLPCLITR